MRYLKLLFESPRVVWLFGFISGFTLLIGSGVMNFWLAQEGIDRAKIGYFALVSLPYAISFLWAPFLDICSVPYLTRYLGHRLSWVVALQFLACIALCVLSQLSPQQNLQAIAALGITITTLSATKDLVLGAWRTELLSSSAQAATSGVYILGYRLGMLVATAGSILLSSYLSWRVIFILIALVLAISAGILISIRDNLSRGQAHAIPAKYTPLSTILRSFGALKFVIALAMVLLSYRLPDHFIITMLNPLLIELNYDETAIATAKVVGSGNAAMGGIVAGYIMQRVSIYRALSIFCIAQGLAHLAFVSLLSHSDYITLIAVTSFEGIVSGMAMAAYITLVSNMCTGEYRATKYAVMMSAMGLSRTLLPSLSGVLVAHLSWPLFFAGMSAFSLIILLLIYLLRSIYPLSTRN